MKISKEVAGVQTHERERGIKRKGESFGNIFSNDS